VVSGCGYTVLNFTPSQKASSMAQVVIKYFTRKGSNGIHDCTIFFVFISPFFCIFKKIV
jgi:hypothetical protein